MGSFPDAENKSEKKQMDWGYVPSGVPGYSWPAIHLLKPNIRCYCHTVIFKICIDVFMGFRVIWLNFPWFESKFTWELEVIFAWLK